jgi:serine/threonine protein kinase
MGGELAFFRVFGGGARARDNNASRALCVHTPIVSHTKTPPSSKLQVGDRYDLVRLLGSGSFSTVCLAVDKETGEEVRRQSGGV